MGKFCEKYARRIQYNAQKYYDRMDSLCPVPEDQERVLDIPYVSQDGTALAADLYRPKERQRDSGLPVIIMVHGGGLFTGSRRMEMKISMDLAGRGFLVCVPEYRCFPDAGICQQMGDVCAGMSFLKTIIPQYGGDLNRVYLVGESAGCLLSVYAMAMDGSQALQQVTGCQPGNLKIQAAAFCSGMFYTQKLNPIGLIYPRNLFREKRFDPDFRKMMNPENPEIITKLPPSLLVSSDGDFLKSYTKKFLAALERNDIKCQLAYYEGNKKLVHTFPTVSPELAESQDVFQKITSWFSGNHE